MNKSTVDIDSKYRWIAQQEVMIYVGKNNWWHQFEPEGEHGKVLCQILEIDLDKIERVE